MNSNESGKKGIFQLSLAEIAFIILLFLTLLLGLRISSLSSEIEKNKNHHKALLNQKSAVIKDLEKQISELRSSDKSKFDSYTSRLCHVPPEDHVSNLAAQLPCIKCIEKTTDFSYEEAKLSLELGRNLVLLQRDNSNIISKEEFKNLMYSYAEDIANNQDYAQQQALGRALLEAFDKGYSLKKSESKSSDRREANKGQGNNGKAFNDKTQQEDYQQAFNDYFNQMKKLGEAVTSDDKIVFVDKGEPNAETKALTHDLDQIYKDSNGNLSFNEFSRDLRSCASGIANGNTITVDRNQYEELTRNEKSAQDKVQNLQEQLVSSRRKAYYFQSRLKSSGFGYPPCWVPEEGEPTRYIVKVIVNSPNNVTVVPAWPDAEHKAKAEKVLPFMEMIRLKNMSMNKFMALANEVNSQYIFKGTENECRYFVALDNNHIPNRKEADRARRTVNSFFYIFETSN